MRTICIIFFPFFLFKRTEKTFDLHSFLYLKVVCFCRREGVTTMAAVKKKVVVKRKGEHLR